jgi:casein kinase 1
MKSTKLKSLAVQISNALDNEHLADLVDEFVLALQMNKSRTLTMDGFAVLDALYRQLEDPSVVAPPLRYFRPSLYWKGIPNQPLEPRLLGKGLLKR